MIGALALIAATLGAGGKDLSLTIQTPADLQVASAVASSASAKTDVPGEVSEHAVLFENLQPKTSYDVKLTLSDGGVIQGVDLSWYDSELAKADAGDLSDEDRSAISDIVHVQSFYNKSDILALRGDHDRAVALVQLVRDKDFYNGKGQIVWRVELWYFQEEFGGWEKVDQQNKIVRRERFKTREEYDAMVGKLKWAPELGGIRLSADEGQKNLKLEEHK
jgi:hypothetical protein